MPDTGTICKWMIVAAFSMLGVFWINGIERFVFINDGLFGLVRFITVKLLGYNGWVCSPTSSLDRVMGGRVYPPSSSSPPKSDMMASTACRLEVLIR